MAFTFNFDGTGFAADKDRVRFHVKDYDTTQPNPKWSDELIVAVIADQGSWQKAVIALLTDLLIALSNPDFKADWLEVSNQKAAADSIRLLLAQKKKELGVTTGKITASFVHVHRQDSLQKTEPSYVEPTEETIQ